MAATLSQKLDCQGAACTEKSAPEDDADVDALPTRPSRPREQQASATLPPPLRPHALAPRSDVAYVPGFVSEREQEALLRHLQPSRTATTTAGAAAAGAAGNEIKNLAPGWRLVSGRRLRVLGGSIQGSGALTAVPLPSWLLPLIERLRLTGVYSDEEEGKSEEGGREGEKRASCSSSSTSTSTSSSTSPPPPNHCLTNCYAPGEGIMPHEDGPLYHPAAAVVSLGSWAVLRFYSKRSEAEEREEEEGKEGEEEGKQKRIDNNRNVFSVALAPRSLVVFTGEAYRNLLHGIEGKNEDVLDASVLNRDDDAVRSASREAAVSKNGSTSSSVRVIRRGGGSESGEAIERISLTVRRVLRVQRNLLRLGPR